MMAQGSIDGARERQVGGETGGYNGIRGAGIGQVARGPGFGPRAGGDSGVVTRRARPRAPRRRCLIPKANRRELTRGGLVHLACAEYGFLKLYDYLSSVIFCTCVFAADCSLTATGWTDLQEIPSLFNSSAQLSRIPP